jgi:hypothetical protein cdiviTM7_00597
MKVFMFISGRSYENGLKYKAFYVCMSFILMALFSTILTVKPAFATDNPHPINHGSVKCPDGYTPKQDGDSGWWGCGYGINPAITCATGWKADFKQKVVSVAGTDRLFKMGHCVEDKGSPNKGAAVEKNAVALADKAGQNSLVDLIAPKIEASPWYSKLSDADMVAAGCKLEPLLPGTSSPDKAWSCNEAAKKKLAKMLIGTCIARAVKTIAKRPDGQDKSNEQIDKAFTECIAGNSGLGKDKVNDNKAPIAWDDIKKDVDTSDSTEKKDEDGEPKKSCSEELVLGWIICPSMSLAGLMADAGYNSVSMFLDISPDIFKDNPELGGAKQAWNFFRDIANVVFVLLFLWVIFSQISNVGVSNYGIKKILPKLILGAILINLSFYICQLAVDLSNILGYALKGVLEVASLKAEPSKIGAVDTFVALFTRGIALVGTALFAFLTVSIPMIIWVLVSLAVAFLILVLRQAAVILLIAISPIAFAAWLLPNTESLFKKWVSAFKGLLVVFPVVSLMYGSGKLAGAVLSHSSSGIIMQFVALCAPIVPLIATPFVIKSSLNSLGSIGAKISNNGLMNFPSNKLKDNVMNKSRFADAKKSFGRYSAKKLAERRSGNSWAHNLKNSNNKFAQTFGKAMTIGTAFDNTRFGRKLGLSDVATNYQEAYDKNAMEKAERALTYQYGGDAEAALKDKKADKYIRIAAVNQLKRQGAHGADVVANYLRNGGEVDSVSMANALTEMKGSHAGVSEAGVSALKALQSGHSSFSLGQKDSSGNVVGDSAKNEFNSLTKDGVRKLSDEGIAKQSADAIEHSAITRKDALRLMKNDRLRSIMSKETKNALVSR